MATATTPIRAARTASAHARLMRMTLRKHGAWLACCAAFLAVLLFVDASAWWQHTQGGTVPATSGALEGQFAFLLFLAALLWPYVGFDVLIVHGVSRRTFARGQMAVNLAVACGAAVVLVAGWLLTTRLGTPLTLRLGPSRFQYLYSSVRDAGTGERIDVGMLPPSEAAAIPGAQPLAMGVGYVFLGTLAMMVAVAMVGQLVGTVFLTLWSRGHRAMAVAGPAVAMVVAFGLGSAWRDLRSDERSAFGRLVDAAMGGVWTTLDGRPAVRTVVWIPLGLAVVFAAAVIWATSALAARCEVTPDRGRFL